MKPFLDNVCKNEGVLWFKKYFINSKYQILYGHFERRSGGAAQKAVAKDFKDKYLLPTRGTRWGESWTLVGPHIWKTIRGCPSNIKILLKQQEY
jgi:hypothetical protein